MHNLARNVTIILSLLLILSLSGMGCAAADTVIVHTNDVHGSINGPLGYDGVSALASAYRDAGDDVIVLSAGDDTQGMFYVGFSRGATAIELMNSVGYQAMAVGNHEFDYGWNRTVELAGMANFPFLSANIFHEGTDELVFPADLVIDGKEHKVGVFGISTPETKTKSMRMNTEGLTVAGKEEMYAIAQKEVDKLRKAGCDYIICLAHLGVSSGSAPNRSGDLADHVSGIDLIIDGHSHTEMPGGEKHGDALIVSTGANLKKIGVVRIADGSTTAELVSTCPKKDAKLTGQIDKVMNALKDEYGYELGTAAVQLNGERAPGVRTEETNFGNLVADAILWVGEQAGVSPDAALVNGGYIRASLPAGTFTAIDIINALPFRNIVMVAEVTGDQLLRDIEANTGSVPEAEGGFPQVSGIVYTVDTAKPYVEGEVNRVTIRSVGGKPFDPKAVYRLVTTDYLLTGGDKYRSIVDAPCKDLSTTCDAAVIGFIQEKLNGTIGSEYANPQGRITVLPSDASSAAPSSTGKSPAPFIGLIAGIGIAALVCAKMRR